MARIALALLLLPFPQDDPRDGVEAREFARLEEDFERIRQISDAETLLQECAQLLADLASFRSRYPNGRKTLAALELLHNTHMTLGLKWLHSDEPDKAEASFTGALRAGQELIDMVRPLQEDPNQDPELSEQMRVYAEYLYFQAAYHRILAVGQTDSRLEEVRAMVDEMEEKFRSFMINYDTWISALDAATFMARALDLLARRTGADRFAETEKIWARCFEFMAKARNLSRKREWKSEPAVQEMSLRSAYHEILARRARAEMYRKAGVPPERELIRALDAAESILTTYPRAAESELGGRIRTEAAAIEKSLRGG